MIFIEMRLTDCGEFENRKGFKEECIKMRKECEEDKKKLEKKLEDGELNARREYNEFLDKKLDRLYETNFRFKQLIPKTKIDSQFIKVSAQQRKWLLCFQYLMRNMDLALEENPLLE